jgi:hypothetical protein
MATPDHPWRCKYASCRCRKKNQQRVTDNTRWAANISRPWWHAVALLLSAQSPTNSSTLLQKMNSITSKSARNFMLLGKQKNIQNIIQLVCPCSVVACSIVPQPTTLPRAPYLPVWSRIFSFPRRPDRLWGPSNLLSNGYRGLSLGVKRPGREADHSLPASAEVKKMWIYTSTPPYACMTQCLIKISVY